MVDWDMDEGPVIETPDLEPDPQDEDEEFPWPEDDFCDNEYYHDDDEAE